MDRDVRFHHVVQDLRVIEARGCARHWVLFHETYTIGFMGRARAGIADWRYRHRSFVVGSEHLVMAMQPGELHATLEQTPYWDFIALQIGDALMRPSPPIRMAVTGAEREARQRRPHASGHGSGAARFRIDPVQDALRRSGASRHRPGFARARGKRDRSSKRSARSCGPSSSATPKGRERRAASARRCRAGKAEEYLRAHYRDAYNLDRVAAASSCGKYYLAHLFKQEFGISPWQYHSRVLVSKTCDALVRSPDRPLGEVAWRSAGRARWRAAPRWTGRRC